ncbi:DUF2459 domain-containing protein [Catalinimonas alkaloidigena]|uniref:DUF2459 domain-containing protein n=1 Tax=Catalinimonas alkaloidigena TaxID=1075417 RepID=UPI0024067E94|nr:DUF2459 domain-containing protein [Catalinimonas alkaloidigena]
MSANAQDQQIYVVSQGWHSGLVVPSSCIADSLWPEKHDYSEYEHIQIGWGDKDFYQNPGFSIWYGAKAVLWPTKSALQVLGLHQLSNLQYYANETVLLQASQAQYTSLCKFLLTQFQQNDSARFIPLKEGLYQNSHFFLGEQSYYFPKNSNVWTASALKHAGFDLTPIWYQSQRSLLKRMKKEGKLVYSKKE